MSGQIVILEDEPRTIERQTGLIRELGLDYRVCPRPSLLGNHLDTVAPDDVRGFVLDMHISKVKTLEELDLPGVETGGGAFVGLAVAEQFLRRPNSLYKDKPVAFLTGYPVKPAVAKRVRVLQDQGALVKLIQKTDETDVFEDFLQELLNTSHGMLSDDKFVEDYVEGMNVASKILDELGLTLEEKAGAFGYLTSDATTWEEIESSLAHPISVDVCDRVEYIIDIKARLEAILEFDIDEQQRWMRTPLRVIGDRTPASMIGDGHQHELVQLVALLRGVTG